MFGCWNNSRNKWVAYFNFRNLEAVLKEDKLKLKRMQKFQPKFTEEQKKELHEVHPWMQKSRLPGVVAKSVSYLVKDK